MPPPSLRCDHVGVGRGPQRRRRRHGGPGHAGGRGAPHPCGARQDPGPLRAVFGPLTGGANADL
jgi:hypothetical protein